MKKQILALVLSVCALGSIAAGSTATATEIANAGGKTESTSSTTKVPKNWTKIYENEYYTTYVENTQMNKKGQGDNRELSVILDRKFTPLGSVWISEINNGIVGPNIITQSIYHAIYKPNESRFDEDSVLKPRYYDANLNLVYRDPLHDLRTPEHGFGPYIPEGENEQIRDTLYHMVGWKTSSDSTTPETRWIKIYENEYYTTYVEKTSIKTRGEAQNRELKAYLKREYTPIGSQWLGENSSGRINPDTVTECIYFVFYQPTHSHLDDYTRKRPKYYDANHRLIFDGPLEDMYEDTGFGKYDRKAENREIKTTLYNLVGWNY